VRLIDLYCSAGGATRGYQLAGFHVTGVDIVAQPNYVGDAFIQADALEVDLSGFDAIHASPPCQRYSAAAQIHDTSNDHPDLIDTTRERLQASGVPWVMENVERSPLRTTLMLCGSMFGLGVRRHRLFESDVLMLGPSCGSHAHWYASVFGGRCLGRQHVTHAGKGTRSQTWDKFDDELATARKAMGISWMNLAELSEAIPPAYSNFIGSRLKAVVLERSAA
jgi:DNA (cytosine-5)-methyltransferase 1